MATIIFGAVKAIKTKFENLDWIKAILTIAFLTMLGVMYTLTFDESARSSAHFVFGSLTVLIAMVFGSEMMKRK